MFNNVWTIIKDSHVLNLAGAIIVLIVGWGLSLLVKKLIREKLKKSGFAAKLSSLLPDGSESKAQTTSAVIAGIVFWVLILLTIFVCLSVLNLGSVARPIKAFLDRVWAYMPNLIAAGLLLFTAWILASIFKYLTYMFLKALKLDEKIDAGRKGDGEKCEGKAPCELSGTIATIVALLTYLFFLPEILSALELTGITAPLLKFLEKILDYLPNLASAAIIVAAGLFAAGLLRRLTLKLLGNQAIEAAGDKIGLKNAAGIKSIAVLVSAIVYALVALPVIAAALDALHIEVLAGATGDLLTRMLNAAGNVFGALLTVFVAYLIGSFAGKIAKDLLSAVGFNKLFRTIGFTKEDAPETDAPSVFAGKLIQIAVVIFGITGGLELMGFDTLANLLRQFIPFAGNIILAAIVFGFGIYLANIAAKAAKANGWEAKLLICGIRVAILFFAGALAFYCSGIASPIVQTAFMLILGAIAVASAIAFGLGGKDFAAKKLAEWDSTKSEK